MQGSSVKGEHRVQSRAETAVVQRQGGMHGRSRERADIGGKRWEPVQGEKQVRAEGEETAVIQGNTMHSFTPQPVAVETHPQKAVKVALNW